MNITVKVDDVALDTVVAEVFGYDGETGERAVRRMERAHAEAQS